MSNSLPPDVLLWERLWLFFVLQHLKKTRYTVSFPLQSSGMSSQTSPTQTNGATPWSPWTMMCMSQVSPFSCSPLKAINVINKRKMADDFEQSFSFVKNAQCSQTAPIPPDRWLARFKYQHLVDHRDLEVHHKRGAMGYRGSHAAAPDQPHICDAQRGDLRHRR